MITPEYFVETLTQKGINFFTGVPDSLLKNVCAYIADHVDARHHVITANEGAAIGLAAGHYLASGNIPAVYMQNSGEGNAINPLASLVDREVYNIPILLIIGWRGEPGIKDEPQHVKQGKVTLSLLEALGIKYAILSKEEKECELQIREAVNYMSSTSEPYALVIHKDTFDTYQLQNKNQNDFEMSREEAIQAVAAFAGTDACIVSTTGMISRELFEYRESMKQGHSYDFLTVGSMGHASQIALGIALEKEDRTVYCFDGDGAVLMHMGSMAIVGSLHPHNYIHIVFNNGAHDSVGGQPTVGLKIRLTDIAMAVGYSSVRRVTTRQELQDALDGMKDLQGPIFVEICVRTGNRKDLGRPTTTPVQNKEALMDFLRKK